MTSEFDVLFSRKAVPLLAKHLGDSDSAIYMPDDSGLRDIPLQHAIIGDESEEEYATDDGIRVRRVREMTLFTDRQHKHFCGTERLSINDGVVIGSTIYAILSAPPSIGGVVDVKLQYVGQREVSKPNLRRNKQ